MESRDFDPADYEPIRLALKLEPPSLALEYRTFSTGRLWIHKIPLPLATLFDEARKTNEDSPETDEEEVVTKVVKNTLQVLTSSDHQKYLGKLSSKQIEGLLHTAVKHHVKSRSDDREKSPIDKEIAKKDCWIDIAINGRSIGRVTIHLCDDVVPETAANFRRMCVGDFRSKSSGKKLAYKNTSFFRIIPGFMCQGGDVVSNDGFGSDSIYGGDFPDENFKLTHQKPGTLSMANDGPDRNGSQFFMTLQPTPHLDNQHVVFGHVIRGMHVLTAMELAGTHDGENMTKKVTIEDCGIVQD